MKMKFSFSLYH